MKPRKDADIVVDEPFSTWGPSPEQSDSIRRRMQALLDASKPLPDHMLYDAFNPRQPTAIDKLRERVAMLEASRETSEQPPKKQAKIIFPKRGEFLKSARNEAGAAIQTFQRELELSGDKGISPRSVNNIERGFKVKPETLKAYVNVLNKLRKAAKLEKIQLGGLPKN